MAVMKVGAAGIETMSGALKRPKKQDGHNHGNYLVATHRVAATTNPNCQRVYSFDADRYKRSTSPNADEMAARERFAHDAHAPTVFASVDERKPAAWCHFFRPAAKKPSASFRISLARRSS